MRGRFLTGAAALLVVAALAAGCGGGGRTKVAAQAVSDSAAGPAEEAQQTAAGDIPDNQVFLTFRNAAQGYSMKYPEGWAQRGAGADVTFQDKDNIVRIDVVTGGVVDIAGATGDMSQLKMSTPSLTFDPPVEVTIGGMHLVKVVYTTESAPNEVTGKRVALVVDRYYVPGAGRHAVIDLGTPRGVDNVDGYRLMIESFQWM